MPNPKRRIKDKNHKKSDDDDSIDDLEPMADKALSLRFVLQIVVITAISIIAAFSKTETVVIFAKQSEIIPGKGEILECSREYKKELNKYEGCFPNKCKRFVTDTIISLEEAEALLVMAKKGLEFGGSSGGASILDLHSGALSTGKHFVNIYKMINMKMLFTEDDFKLFKVVKQKIKNIIAQQFQVTPDKVYLTHPTFFSEITSKDAVTVHDEYWHPHVDKETYKSFHYTSLLYLTDYNLDFKGGRFMFKGGKWNKSVEPRKGRLSVFTSGAENLHFVEKVTSGVRYAITISFTCDAQFAIEDPSVDKYNV